MADRLAFMTECLKEFDYPNVHGMDDLQIMDIFSTGNRQFLVSWILKKLHDGYPDIIQNSSKEQIAEIVHCHGFCKNSEKDNFMNGTSEVLQQLTILYKMFNHLKDVTDSKKLGPELKTVSIEEVEELAQCNTNLFPMYGPQQTLTPEERQLKLEAYHKEIEDIKNRLGAASHSQNKSVDPNLRQQLEDAMRNLELNAPGFKREALDVLMKNKDVKETDSMIFGDDFEETLESCNTHIKKVSEYLKNTNVVMSFKGNNSELPSENENRSNVMVKKLADLCNEIAALRQNKNDTNP